MDKTITKLEWDDDLDVNHDLIDEQHKELVNRLNGLLEASTMNSSEVMSAIENLYAYIEKHHYDEEILQLEYGYPDFRAHKFQHQIFMNRFFILKNSILINVQTPSNITKSVGDFANWVIRHIKREDKKVGAFIKQARQIEKRNHARFNNNRFRESLKEKADFPTNQKKETRMSIKLGDTVPNFIAETTEGKINFYEWLGDSWAVFFSHPADYTPVCTTELGHVAKIKDEFTKRNTRVIAISVDDLEKHKGWIKDINETQNTTVNYPIIADPEKKVAFLYGMIHPNASDTATVRSVYIIGPDKKLKLSITYPASTGRNFAELLRVIDSLQLTANYRVATPANWVDGQDCVVVPTIKTEDIPAIFPKGFKEIKPYLRLTPQPNK